MTRRTILSLAGAAALVALLSACNISIVITPPTPDQTVTATNSRTSLDGVTLGANQQIIYKLDVSAVTGPLLYVELNDALDLVLYDQDGYALASSVDSTSFASGVSALSLGAGAALQSVVQEKACAGSCVIRKLGASNTYYAKVVNHTGGSLTTQFYAYGSDYQDANETANNSSATSPVLTTNPTGDAGAIETLGDQDYWYVNANGSVYFDAKAGNPLNLRLEVRPAIGSPFTYSPNSGTPFEVLVGDDLVVYSSTGLAGAAASSTYYLSYQ
jgi:hypothetical protein